MRRSECECSEGTQVYSATAPPSLFENPECVKLLLDHGAKVDVKNATGYTPLLLEPARLVSMGAQRTTRAEPKVVRLAHQQEVLTHTSCTPPALSAAMMAAYANLAGRPRGADRSATSISTFPGPQPLSRCLSVACVAGSVPLVRMLLEYGVDYRYRIERRAHDPAPARHRSPRRIVVEEFRRHNLVGFDPRRDGSARTMTALEIAYQRQGCRMGRRRSPRC